MKIKVPKPKNIAKVTYHKNNFFLNIRKKYSDLGNLLEENKVKHFEFISVNGSIFSKLQTYRVFESLDGRVEVKTKKRQKVLFHFESLCELRHFFKNCRRHIHRPFDFDFVEFKYESRKLVNLIKDENKFEIQNLSASPTIIFGPPKGGCTSPVGKVKPLKNPLKNGCNYKIGSEYCGRPTYLNEDKCQIHC